MPIVLCLPVSRTSPLETTLYVIRRRVHHLTFRFVSVRFELVRLAEYWSNANLPSGREENY